jgi:phosphonoacetate hydrolase
MKKLLSFSLACLICLCSFAQQPDYYEKYYSGKRILIFMVDGFGQSYLNSTMLPNIMKLQREGFGKIVDALMPTVTNCNNAAICCGEFPDKTGITGNSFLDANGKEEYMESKDLLMGPTIFEKLAKRNVKSALFSAKKKSVGLLSKSVEIAMSPETADSSWIKRFGNPPAIYSREVNYWLMEAALYTIKNRKDISCFYIHTTDYPMHTWAPQDSNSINHLKKIDEYIGRFMEADPGALILLTADHDVNHKDVCVDIEKSLASQQVKVKIAISAERDKYLKHHRGFGGASFVYLNNLSYEKQVKAALYKIKGVKTVLTKKEAAAKYHLLPERIGDLIVLADSLTVFGNLETEREQLPATYRTHGSEYELKVPLMIYNATKRPGDDYFKYNKDLTSWLFEKVN